MAPLSRCAPGAAALGWTAVLTIGSNAVLAARVGDPLLLSPLTELQNFSDKTRPGRGFGCQTLNFAPGSALCRLIGPEAWIAERILAIIAVTVLGVCVIGALRGRSARSWETFAFTCPLSVMLSPVAWSHYQAALAPLFVLLVVRFVSDGADTGAWAGLATAFALASLTWQPYGSWLQSLGDLLSGHAPPHSYRPHDAAWIPWAAQSAQYVLVITAAVWYAQTRTRLLGDRRVEPIGARAEGLIAPRRSR